MRFVTMVGAAVVGVLYLAGAGQAGDTKTVNVDCGAGDSPGAALAQHAKPGRALTVNISGTCVGNIVVTADETTLRADAAGATLTSTDPDQSTVVVDGAARVVIDGLIVSGARNGIVATGGASVTVQNVKAQNNAQSGIVSFASSRVAVDASEATGNGTTGILVTDNAAGFVTNSTIQNNGTSGVGVQRASSARVGQSGTGIAGPNTIRDNGRNGVGNGVFVYESAQALVVGNSITGNAAAGVSIEGSSATVVANSLESNGTYGVLVTNNSGARIGITDATTPAGNTIQSNGLDGVNISNGSNANMFGNTIRSNRRDGINISRATGRLIGSHTIEANLGRGISVAGGALFQAAGDFGLTPNLDTIQSNGSDGIGVFQGASAELQNATVRGNGLRGIVLSNGASLRILNSTVSGNAGDGIGVFTGSSLLVNSPTVTVTGNTANGINLFDGATGDIQFASITSNGSSGIVASTGSKLRVLGTTIDTHPGLGVGAFDATTVSLQCSFAPFPACAAGSANTITNNSTGVSVATGSTGIIQGATIRANGTGVVVDTNSTLRLQTPGTQVTVNRNGGIIVLNHSVVNFNSPPAVVSDNDGPDSFQVNCFGAPSVLIGNTSGVGPGGVSTTPTCGPVF